MTAWVLAVKMESSGDLGRTLKTAARDARAMSTSLKAAQHDAQRLGTTARATSRDVLKLGTDSRSAARGVDTLATAARAAQRQLALISRGSADSRAGLRGMRSESTQSGRDLQRMSRQVTTTIRDLNRLATAARTAGVRAGAAGTTGAAGMGRLERSIGGVRSRLSGVLTLLAGGALLEGSVEMVKHGNELTQSLNTFGAVSSATSMQMARAGATANQLGNDLELPKASAIDAADAMVELSKAGFRTDQAISATRASLLLSAAAQTDAADSAKYLGDIMDQFGLSADRAGQTADTLAATANNASGGVKEIYYAMSYAGPVAHGLGISMQDASVGVGMLAKSGILGSKAGTALRGMLTNLAKPTKQMSDGLHTLGIQAFDSQGNFKGLRYVIEKLGSAQEKLSQKDFTAAAGKAFGKPALASAVALAHQGTESFDALSIAVRQQGAAATIAASQGKGLAGAMVQLKTQSRQTGLAIYQGMSPGLEYITRGLTKAMAESTPHITDWIHHLNSAAYLFGPDLKKGIHNVFADITDEAKGLGGSFKEFGMDAAADALHVIVNAGKAAVTVLKNLVAGAEPVVKAMGEVSGSGDGVSSTLDTVVYVLDETAHAIGVVSGVLVPLGSLVGGLVHDFSELPGPVQAAFLAMLLARRVTGPLTAATGRVSTSLRTLNDDMRVQQSLAASSGVSIGRYGAAFSVLQARVPVIGRMATSFRTASAASTGFAGSLRGVTAAAGTGLRGALGGITGALGGPWGIAITAATIGLGMLAARHQKAAQATAEHKADLDNLTQAMQKSNGVIDESVREQAASMLQSVKVGKGNTDLVAVLNKAGYSLRDVTDAYLGQGVSLKTVASRLDGMAKKQDKAAGSAKSLSDQVGKGALADAYRDSAKHLRDMEGEAEEAQRKAKDLNAAIKGASGGTSSYDRLKAAVGDLSDQTADADSRTRALKQALDLLSGGTLDYQAAEAKMNTAISNANDQMADGVKKADGWNKALLNANGTVSTVTKNGQQLYNQLTDIGDSTTAAAQAAFSLAQSQGKDLPASLGAARKEMERGRTAALNLAKQYGIQGDAAKKVADSVGLIPGQVAILLETEGVDTVLAELLAVQAQMSQTPNAKKITVETLSAEAQAKLKDLGWQIRMIPGTRQFELTVPTGKPKSAISDLKQAIDGITGKTVHINVITTEIEKRVKTGAMSPQGGKNAIETQADGGIVDFYADGGVREDHRAQIVPAGSWRVFGEPETGGEAYVPLAPAKRPRSRKIAEEAVRRLGGDPSGIQWNADGSITAFADGGFTYAPTGVSRTASDVQSAYSDAHQPISREDYDKKIRARANALGTLRTAEARLEQVRSHRHTHAALVAAENSVAKARRTVATATTAAQKAEAAYRQTFSLSDWSKTLSSTVKANASYEANLSHIANRGGGDVIDQLRDMGAEGAKLVSALSHATTSQFNKIVADLRKLGPLAKATLADYTKQLNAASNTNTAFATNLAKLAAMGFGDLAAQLSAQGDAAAQKIAAAAVKDKKAASSANAQAKRAANQLTGDQVTELVQIIAAVKTSKTGIHAVADTTGLGEDEIVTVATKAAPTIKSTLGSRASKFLADLARAQKGLSYENGGIRPGIYATHAGAVTFAEPATGGEAYVPLGANKRAAATRVMGDVAHRFGLGLTAAGADRSVTVIRQDGPLHVHVSTVRTNATASDIATQVGRQYRRARRGGVAARDN